MNTQRKNIEIENNQSQAKAIPAMALNWPTLMPVPSLRRQLALALAAARDDIGELTVLRHKAAASGVSTDLVHATRALRNCLVFHSERVMKMKEQLILDAIKARLSKVSDCEFHMMVDLVPYYYFTDRETGMRYDGIAYGTEANRVMYQHKAGLERAVRIFRENELEWVNEALASWKKALASYACLEIQA